MVSYILSLSSSAPKLPTRGRAALNRQVIDLDRQRSAWVAKKTAEEARKGKGGFDVKVSSNPFARRLARHLTQELGGAAITSSATLHTQREGREQYRATYLVRLPAFRKGDVVLWRRARYRVVAVGDPVRLEHAETGEMMRVRPRELRTARVVAK